MCMHTDVQMCGITEGRSTYQMNMQRDLLWNRVANKDAVGSRHSVSSRYKDGSRGRLLQSTELTPGIRGLNKWELKWDTFIRTDHVSRSPGVRVESLLPCV